MPLSGNGCELIAGKRTNQRERTCDKIAALGAQKNALFRALSSTALDKCHCNKIKSCAMCHCGRQSRGTLLLKYINHSVRLCDARKNTVDYSACTLIYTSIRRLFTRALCRPMLNPGLYGRSTLVI